MNPLANSSPPTVAYVLKRFPRLSETFIRREIRELERRGARVEIFSLLRPLESASREAVAGLKAPVTYLTQRPSLAGALPTVPGDGTDRGTTLRTQAAALASAVSSRGLAHMHAHFATDATAAAMMASRLIGTPYSFTAHAKDIFHDYGDRASADRSLIEKIRDSSFVVTVSDYNHRHLVKLAGPRAGGKILRLYNGVDLDRIRPSPDPGEADLILAVGRLVEKKGFRHLLDACVRLRGARARFKCLIVGDGPERIRLSRQIADLGIGDCVTLAGSLTEEQTLCTIEKAGMLVLPAVVSVSGDREGLPTVLVEALAAGVPAISTAVSGIPEIITHRSTGLLVPPGNPVALADAILELLARPALRRELARRGRVKAEREFDVKRNVDVLYRMFADSSLARSADRWGADAHGNRSDAFARHR